MDTIAVLEALLTNLGEKYTDLQTAYDTGVSEDLDQALIGLSYCIENTLSSFKAYFEDLNKRDRYVIENIRYQLQIEELEKIINKQANQISILQYQIESQGL
ncbi:MAG: hypothetical protein K0S61_724 [Anaerocolumna sp.]|jgi:hypothetical protein|nr:hypothetical protein [Anaerocolumna sp.]